MTRLKTVKPTRAMQRLLNAARAEGQGKRKTLRQRLQRRVYRKLTNAEKKAKKARRLEEKNFYQEKILEVQKLVQDKAAEIHELIGKHSVQHIVDDIYQTHRLKKHTRKVGMFNAFMSLEMARINNEIPEGVPRRKAPECMGEIAEKWAAMSPEERKIATSAHLKVLEDAQENRTIGRHNIALSAFHDLTCLYNRTGNEILLVVTGRVDEFFELTFKLSLEEISWRMEGYMISGVKGIVRNHAQRLLREKSELASLILTKLHAQLTVAADIHVLSQAWVSGTTCFYKMSKEERQIWEEEYNSRANQRATSWQPVGGEGSVTNSAPAGVAAGAPQAASGVTFINSYASVTASDGVALQMQAKKPRKRHSDFGTKCKKPSDAGSSA